MMQWALRCRIPDVGKVLSHELRVRLGVQQAHSAEDLGKVNIQRVHTDKTPIDAVQQVWEGCVEKLASGEQMAKACFPDIAVDDVRRSAFAKSNERLVRFTEGKPVAHILGCHIEQTRTPFLDYPVGTIYQPNEHELSLSRGALLEMQAALDSLHGAPKRVAYRDFSLWPVGPAFSASDQSQSTFKQTQKRQLDHMWDQTQP